MKLRTLTLLAPLLLLPCGAQAQQAVRDAPEAEPTESIDDVVVVRGWRHPVQLRLQMVNAELAVYDLFNQFNDDASLMLQCSRRNVGGTRLQTTDCAPRFENEAYAEEGRFVLEAFRASLNATAMTSELFSPGPQPADAAARSSNSGQFQAYMPAASGMSATMVIQAGQSRLQNKMDEIAAEHPEFVEALKTYVDAKDRYTQALRRD